MLYLASRSPRRRDLLDQLGVDYRLLNIDADEQARSGEPPEDYVKRIAFNKAAAGSARVQDGAVLAADTAVVADRRIMGKPLDAHHAIDMLMTLSGRSHRVLTGVALAFDHRVEYRQSDSEVIFRVISADEAWRYWRSGEPTDKAGGYAIQGLGALFISELKGSYSGVMGLPLFETAELLKIIAIDPLPV